MQCGKYREFLKALNASAVTIGNNHIGDYGAEAVANTLVALDENNIAHTGAGRNIDDAYSAVYLAQCIYCSIRLLR